MYIFIGQREGIGVDLVVLYGVARMFLLVVQWQLRIVLIIMYGIVGLSLCYNIIYVIAAVT